MQRAETAFGLNLSQLTPFPKVFGFFSKFVGAVHRRLVIKRPSAD
jgi:hypothetical protein